ncbi:tyrosine-type recombinase/integrase [Desulfotomaculum sp. 1211_IL3151]|uniref:tyrosine-type recombinase/integrase n=1 Tax=Desulfotomaculum sp. 1211_IL3151 TaxID=3084055 RepID=UPI002FD8B08C
MTKLETIINTILQRLKSELANETWESRRRYFNQMLKCAKLLGITEPCAKLYDEFIRDDNGSPERHALHIRCVKLVDALAFTQARDEHGIPFNEPSMPDDAEVHEFFQGREFPIAADVRIDHLIVKAEIEMKYLNLTDSTIGQYKHSWMDIRRYFYDAGVFGYDETLMKCFIQEINNLRHKGSMKEWKWKINRKAAHVLIEVANTGRFLWGMIKRDARCHSLEAESIRSQYLKYLEQRNLSRSTIDLHDYVFRKTVEFSGIETAKDLLSLSPGKIHLVITKFAGICNRRSMATLLPILRSLLAFFHTTGLIKKDLSGIVMGVFVQRGSVAAYISEKDQTGLVAQLAKEPKRTKAIILLAMHLGLRDCDICNLTFQTIDWRNDKIRLIQKKTGEPLVLPLLPDVGNALMDYILNERPKRADHYPYIFLRKQAPHNKLTSVYPTCSRLLGNLGIKPINGTARGVHLFRYSMVHKLLAAKVPHQVITDTLGHTSRESDKPYLSMEESMLRACALNLSVIGRVSWRGGASNDGLSI